MNHRPDRGFRSGPFVSIVAICCFFLVAADEPAKPKPILELNGAIDKKTSQFNRVVFSPDSKRLASAGQYGTAKVWDCSSGKEILSLKSDPKIVWNVAFSPDGKQLASGNGDGTVKIWNADSGREIRTLKGHGRQVFGVAFSPDSKQLASGAIKGGVQVWDLASGKEVVNLNEPNCQHLAYSPDGMRLAAAIGHSVKLWNTSTWKPVFCVDDDSPIFTIAFSPDGKRIASAGSLGNSLVIWDAATGKKLMTIFAIMTVAFTPDGKLIAGLSDSHLKLWDAANGKELVSLKEQGGEGVCFSPDGKRLATVNTFTVTVWDVAELLDKAKTK
jgi:WD40 repeat protein